MCICASDTSRSRLFNWVLVMLVTGWVTVVAVIAHSVPGNRNSDINQVSIEAPLTSAIEALTEQ
ncbi:MAG: hypothetical protein ACE37D_20610 [Pseudomonadales bacterium]|jgi:hypothetical protein